MVATKVPRFLASQHLWDARYLEVEDLKEISNQLEEITIIQSDLTIEVKHITLVTKEEGILDLALTMVHSERSAQQISTLLVTEEAAIMAAQVVDIIISTILTTSIHFRVSNRTQYHQPIKIIQVLDIQLSMDQIISISLTWEKGRAQGEVPLALLLTLSTRSKAMTVLWTHWQQVETILKHQEAQLNLKVASNKQDNPIMARKMVVVALLRPDTDNIQAIIW